MITSRYNPQFKELKSLLEPKGARKAGKVLVSGRKIVPELVTRASLIITEEDHWPNDLPHGEKVMPLERQLFRDLDIFGTHYPLAVCDLPRLAAWQGEPPSGLELVLSLQEPSNLGAVVRSAEAFGVAKIILLKECVFPFHPKAIRASSGSCFRVAFAEGPSQKEFDDANTVALDASGDSITSFAWPRDCRLMIGEEGQGIAANFNGQKLSIPMSESLDSLNAGIAASIACYVYRSKYPL